MNFIDLKAQQVQLRGKIDARIKTVLDHGQYIMGPEIAELEKRLCAFTGAKHCLTCSSGTDALIMILMAWGIRSGDAVFMPPFSFFATAEAVAILGAVPVFVDIDPVTFNLCPHALQKAIRAVRASDSSIYPLPAPARTMRLNPRAIIPVDLFGQPAHYDALLPLANEYNLLVLEDAAQAFGATRHGRKTCAMGCHAAATSFFPAKPLGCYGDGGAVFTDDDALKESLESIRIHGKGKDKYDNIRLGLNARMDTIQAAILLEKLDIFPEELESRQKVSAWYATHLSALPHITLSNITPPHIEKDNVSAWAQYSILVGQDKRDTVAAYLKTLDIPTNIYYPIPMHMLQVFRHLDYVPEDMPIASQCSRSILALPFHPYMEESSVCQVVDGIKDALR